MILICAIIMAFLVLGVVGGIPILLGCSSKEADGTATPRIIGVYMILPFLLFLIPCYYVLDYADEMDIITPLKVGGVSEIQSPMINNDIWYEVWASKDIKWILDATHFYITTTNQKLVT